MTRPGFSLFDTAIGRCAIAWGEHGIYGAQLPEASDRATRARLRQPAGAQEAPAPPDVQCAIDALVSLLRGERTEPDALALVPLDMEGVPAFNRRVYEVTRAIAPGTTLTYGEVAARIGEPGAARAVGQALGHNPFAPIVPCHRVLAAGSGAGGFSARGGVTTKLRMLLIEGAAFGAPGLFDSSVSDQNDR